MQFKQKVILFLLVIISISCTKEPTETITIQGIVQDEVSKEPISNIYISIDAIKSSTGMGIITDGKRETIGYTTTDKSGYYKIKLKVFKGAERLEFYINPIKTKQGYVESQQDIDISAINKSRSDNLNFALSPTARLKINFKNATPFSDTDSFSFSWFAYANGWPEGIIQKENCGTVLDKESLIWIGKDVCGAFTIGTIAERYTQVYWNLRKNGIYKQYKDSIYVKRNVINQFSINY